MYKHLLFHLNNFISVYRGVCEFLIPSNPAKIRIILSFPSSNFGKRK